jgi:hypothetical protein
MTMAATDPSHPTRRELAHRLNNDVDVTLWWDPHTNAVTVSVRDRNSGAHFQLDADGANALDVFHHPYAHAAARGIEHSSAGTR